MADYDYGPLRSYEVTWASGHVETLQGHSVQFESGGFSPVPNGIPRMRIYGMFPGGQWSLVLMAPEADILFVRDVTDREQADRG